LASSILSLIYSSEKFQTAKDQVQLRSICRAKNNAEMNLCRHHAALMNIGLASQQVSLSHPVESKEMYRRSAWQK